MTELEALLILNAVTGLSGAHIQKLFECFGSFKKVLNSGLSQLKGMAGLTQKTAENIVGFDRDSFLKSETKLIHDHQVNIVSWQDEAYPGNLKNIPDAPVLLYVKGQLQKENNLAVSIVGSRRASLYGLSVAEKFARELSQFGVTVVSGLARGIDTAAHQGALKSKGKTIAVLGSGLSVVYPSENKKLFDDIVQSGAVVSEFPMTMPPLAYNFPRRNRIISGLSLGVIVVEAAKKSGALITSRMALEQGREVFAVPGKVDSPNSQGTHELIKQGAKLTHSIEDILEELAVPFKNQLTKNIQADDSPGENILDKNLNNDEAEIYKRMNEPIHIDDIAEQSGYSPSKASSVLLALELKHLIKQLPGKVFVKADPTFKN